MHVLNWIRLPKQQALLLIHDERLFGRTSDEWCPFLNIFKLTCSMDGGGAYDCIQVYYIAQGPPLMTEEALRDSEYSTSVYYCCCSKHLILSTWELSVKTIYIHLVHYVWLFIVLVFLMYNIIISKFKTIFKDERVFVWKKNCWIFCTITNTNF